MSEPELQPQQRAKMRELLQDATLRQALDIVESRCPRAFTPGADLKLDTVALQAAHRQGYMDCLNQFKKLATDSVTVEESPFMEMDDNAQPKSDSH